MSTIAAGSLMRTRGGGVVHRVGCISVIKGLPRSRPVPWRWADGRDSSEVIETIRFHQYALCRDCMPFTTVEETQQ
jgi:hypothetical protein